ncbi:DUF488 domain-containing protein [Hydrogenobaculum acidophilum]
MIKTKRVYEPKEDTDGLRILVDRLWPRGIKKDKVDLWLKDIAPSDKLRKFYHETKDFEAFKKSYVEELQKKDIKELLDLSKQNTITLLYASKEPQNNAAVLKEYLEWTLEKQK